MNKNNTINKSNNYISNVHNIYNCTRFLYYETLLNLIENNKEYVESIYFINDSTYCMAKGLETIPQKILLIYTKKDGWLVDINHNEAFDMDIFKEAFSKDKFTLRAYGMDVSDVSNMTFNDIGQHAFILNSLISWYDLKR